MKIDGMRTGSAQSLPVRDGDHVAGADTDFSAELMEQESSMSRDQLEKLLQEIDKQGARLSKTPTYEELGAYRDLIKKFVSEAVNSMYEYHTQSGWDSRGRQKSYTTVRKIDKKLEEMAEKIRLGQADQLNIIASHDAIRGMLVDLYM